MWIYALLVFAGISLGYSVGHYRARMKVFREAVELGYAEENSFLIGRFVWRHPRAKVREVIHSRLDWEKFRNQFDGN